MNVYIFTWKHSQSNAFLFFILKLIFYFETYLFWTLLVVLRHPHQRARRVISDWTVLEVNTQERRLLEQTDQWLTLTFRWKLNKQRCVRERMSILSISFNIVTVVYGINLKILMSHNNSFQNCPIWCCLSMLGFNKRFSSNFSQPASIRPCTLRFRALPCSMERPGASPWQAHVAFESYSRRNGGWWTLARVMATIELSSRYGIKFSIWQRNLGWTLQAFCCKIPFCWCFLVCAKGGVRHWKCGRQALWLI